jgi:ubiquinone/menaquinone biosynthesis C-methylase UbiE
MPSEVSRLITAVAYGLTQIPRVGWYVRHSLVLRELASRVRATASESARGDLPHSQPVPDRKRIYADMAKLFLQDLSNVEAGIYPLPADRDGSLPTLIRRSQRFFDDLPNVYQRRERSGHSEVVDDTTRGRRPRYYLQNFHYQSGGWMTDNSAELYDTQVEVLFNGSANAIRRQAIPPLHEVFAGRDQRRLSVLDIGCGTGRFLEAVKQVWPRMPIIGIDMSDAYIRHARRYLRRRSYLKLAVAKAEALPMQDNSVDAITSIFMFHELPPKIRRSVVNECARVLKPGGRFVLVDSLQHGDEPDYDGLLENFPQNYHEPYYRNYLKEDFSAIAKDCGLIHVRDTKAFISKVMVFDKQDRQV